MGGEGGMGGMVSEGGMGGIVSGSCPVLDAVEGDICDKGVDPSEPTCAYGKGFCHCPIEGKVSGVWSCFECPSSIPKPTTPGAEANYRALCEYGDAVCSCGFEYFDGPCDWECTYKQQCSSQSIGVTMTSSEAHDHMSGALPSFPNIDSLVNWINGGAPLVFNLPQEAAHTHTITFTPAEYATLRAGGSVPGKTTSVNGSPAHTHVYTFECAP